MGYKPSVNHPASLPSYVFEKDGQRRWLYVMRCQDHYVKIGLADDPQRRLAQVQVYNPLPVVLIATRSVPTTVALWVEKRVHQMLGEQRLHGEWFKVDKVTALKAIVQALRDGEVRARELRGHARAIMEDVARERRDPNRKAEAIALYREMVTASGADERP